MILDIVIPIYNNEKQILNIYNKINEELKNIRYNIIFVNDGSNDKSIQVITDIYKENESTIKVIDLAKIHGKDYAIYTGILYSTHDLICIYDIDLQANVSHISKMYSFLKEHPLYDQICMCSNNEINNKKINLYNKIFKTTIDYNKTYFRLFKKNIKKALIDYSEFNMFDSIGFNTYYFKFECKNNNDKIKFDDFLLNSNNPFILIKYGNCLLLCLTLILLILSIFNIIKINSNVLLISLLLLIILIIRLQIFFKNYSVKKYQKKIISIREKQGFDENVL